MICRDHRAVLAGKCRPFRSRAFRLKRHKRQDRLRRSHAHAASDTLGLLTEHGIDLCRRKSQSCPRCYAKELNPAGLLIPTPTQLDRPLDPDHTFVRNPRALTSAAELWGSRSLRGGQRRRSLYPQEQLARFPHQFSNVPAFRNSLASVAAMLKRVLVASRGARSQRTPMHAAAPLAMDRW